MRTIYEDPRARSHGRAQLVSHGREGATGEESTIFPLSEALYQSLFQLGILNRFATGVPNNGWLDMAEEGILFHEGLHRAVQLLHHDAACAMGNTYDWLCSQQFPTGIEYRLRVDGCELQRELLALAAFFEEGVQRGCDVQLWL